MNPFADMMKDEVFIENAVGKRQGPFQTAFGGKGVSIFDETLDVSEGDKAIRFLPNGKEERYTIVEVLFSQGLTSIPPHYTLKLSKDGAIRFPAAPTPVTAPVHKTTTNHITIHGSQGIQIGDHNIQNLQLALEKILQHIDDSDAPREDREEAKARMTQFLAHPLVATIVGASLPVALGLLS